jgi:hypothetical protein
MLNTIKEKEDKNGEKNEQKTKHYIDSF